MRLGGIAGGLILTATAGCGGDGSTFAAGTPHSYENVGAREPGIVLADGQSCTFEYAATPMTVADYAALPGPFSSANIGSPILAEVTILTEVAYVYGPVNGDSGGYGPGTDVSQNVSVGTLADVWDTQLDPGMARCCQDLIIAADEQGDAFTVSGIGSGAFGQTDERVLFDKVQSCALGLGSIAPSGIRLKGSGLQCSTTTSPRLHCDGLVGSLAIAALAVFAVTKRRRS